MTGRVSPSAGSMPMSRVGVRRLAAHACASGESASSIQVSGRRPANLATAGSLSRGWNGTGGKRITGRSGNWSRGARSRLASAPYAVAHTIWNRVASSRSHGPCVAHSRTGSSPGKNSCSV